LQEKKKRIEASLASGYLTDLWPAYSKIPDVKPQHIQDVIQDQAEVLWNLLTNDNAVVFVCGDVKIGYSVREAFTKLAKTQGKLNPIQANVWLNNLISERRFRHDEWGLSTISAASVIRSARLRLWRKSILATFAFIKSPKKDIKNIITTN